MRIKFWRDLSQAIDYAKQGRIDEFLTLLDAIETEIAEDEIGRNGRLLVCSKARETYAGTGWSEITNSLQRKLFNSNIADSKSQGQPVITPTFVVVTPAYNAAAFIDETITSVVSQRGDFLVLYHVQDGGSTDGTVETLKNWAARLKNGNPFGGAAVRFSWRSEPDKGMYDAIALGFEYIYAKLEMEKHDATIMTWLNADDLLATNALRTACAYFKEHPEFNWITGMGALMNEEGAAVRVFSSPINGFPQQSLAAGLHDGRTFQYVQQEGTFWRRPLWTKTGGLSRALKLAGDWDLWRRFALQTPLLKIQTVLALHRRRAGQLSENPSHYYAELDALPAMDSDAKALDPLGFSALYDLETAHWTAVQLPPEEPDPISMLPALVEPLIKKTAIAISTVDCDLPATLPSGRPWPKISVITPSFNQGRYIGETIESVIQQRYPYVEHIIIDGGSTDETMEVVGRYRSSLAYVVSEKDGGQSDALNKGFQRSTGDILCWLNSDDQFAPGALAAVAMAFDTSGADLVSGICEIYQDGQLIQRHMTACSDGPLPLNDLLDLDNGWNGGQFFYQPEVFFSRGLWLRAGAHVREDCYYSMDYELWCRFAEAAAKLHVIGRPLARFRMHPDQKTADPAKFKAELIEVRDRFATTRSIRVSQSVRPTARWDRTLRVAMVNDIGALYGAGIAHNRLAAAMDMAGHTVELFALSARMGQNGKVDERKFIDDVIGFEPDVVVFGNLHAATRDSVAVVEALSEKFPSFWITHDFWLFTGRCAYPGVCEKYFSGCDVSCPTPNQYPDLAPKKIASAWKRKRELLGLPHAPVVLANSAWSSNVAKNALAGGLNGDPSRVAQIKLGFPTHLFKPLNRSASRKALGINPDLFVIAFSVSSLTDERKGGRFLKVALEELRRPNVALLLIGNQDVNFDLQGVEMIALGYVNDAATLVNALSAADVYVGPSVEETFGQVFVEAALVGTPSIGFNQTGVVDSIVDGVTGFRVDANAQALKGAIMHLYDNKKLCSNIGRWASIFASNEFSLESAYQSIFNVWRSQGLIDKWELPHKVGFVRPSSLIDDTLGLVATWRPTSGVSTLEGPYPESNIPSTFRWCCAPKVCLMVNCGEGGCCTIRLIYYSNLFEIIKADVHVNGQSEDQVIFHRTSPGMFSNVDIAIKDAQPGWVTIELQPDVFLPPTDQETRSLVFMLKDVELLKADK